MIGQLEYTKSVEKQKEELQHQNQLLLNERKNSEVLKLEIISLKEQAQQVAMAKEERNLLASKVALLEAELGQR